MVSPIVFSRSYASSRERRLGRIEEVGVRAHARPADAATELVELPEPEPVGAVDDERVHRRHVDAGLDDRRADEHVVLVLPEVEHHPLERAFVHLSVRDGDTGLRNELADVRGGVLDVVHAVVHEEHLPFAEQLAPDRFADGAVVVLADVREDRLALGRWRVQQA